MKATLTFDEVSFDISFGKFGEFEIPRFHKIIL